MASTNGDMTIDLHDVRKTYRRRIHALRGVDLQVHRGEIFGLLGPNGAGKTTLVKIMMSVVRPDHVEGTLLGHPVGHKPTLAHVGYLPEHHRFPAHLRGREVVEFFGAMAKVPRAQRKRRAGELLELVNMSEWAQTKVGSYSKGMLQRIGLAQALVNDPALVVLDEPTDGVDPVGRREIRQVLVRMREEGRSVFLNSHLLSEIEMVCDRVAILRQGQVARQGTVDELTAATHRYFEITLQSDQSPEQLRAALGEALATPWEPPAESAPATRGDRPAWRGKAQGQAVELDGQRLRVLTQDAKAVQPVIDALRRGQHVIERVQPVRLSLEDLFIQTVDQAQNGVGA